MPKALPRRPCDFVTIAAHNRAAAIARGSAVYCRTTIRWPGAQTEFFGRYGLAGFKFSSQSVKRETVTMTPFGIS